jgi:hypothetical protein
MILRHLIPKLEAHFAGQFSVSGAVVTFPERHAAVGSVEIHDDAEELTVYVGSFTHVHFSNYDSSLSKEQAAERIADDALAFLIKLFVDQIVMWGSHGGRGGCYEREAGPSSIFSFSRGQEYVWSGPVSKRG